MIEFLARRYDDRRVVSVRIDGSVIQSVEAPKDAVEAATLPVVAPAFFDHQINGFGGVWFSDAGLTIPQVVATAEAHFQFGIARMFPTLITNSFAALQQGFKALREACEEEPWGRPNVSRFSP